MIIPANPDCYFCANVSNLLLLLNYEADLVRKKTQLKNEKDQVHNG